jgi:hypothetical protein
MNAEELRAVQAPLKQSYRDTPDAARVPARAEARLTHQSVIKTTFLLYMTASGAISAG